MRADDVTVTITGHVACVEIHRPPDNYFDAGLISQIAAAYEALDADSGCRAIVLCSEGKHFCAGANLNAPLASGVSAGSGDPGPLGAAALYTEAIRLFRTGKPVIAAVQGAAVGGGLGLACSADFRVATPQSRFVANFARLGFHHGFGLTVTLPAIVGQQHALELLYTGRRVTGEEAARIGLADRLVPEAGLREAAQEFAAQIAGSAPLAVRSIRATMRAGLADRVRAATAHEAAEQERLRSTADWAEGVDAVAQRRVPDFKGR